MLTNDYSLCLYVMKEITLIFPHQLFKDHPSVDTSREIWIIEDVLFFNQYNFHKKKLVLHRASMKYYVDQLTLKKHKVKYIECDDVLANTKILFEHFKLSGVNTIHYCDVVDYLLERRINRYAAVNTIKLIKNESLNFICTLNYLTDYFKDKKRFFQTEFYIDQRKRFNILITNEKPLGGKWTYDVENRKKIPTKTIIPAFQKNTANKFVNEAIDYVDKKFSINFGETKSFVYPITHHDAENWLDTFLEERFQNYGIYQDAIVKNETFLFHSILTPMLNIGLLEPQQVIEKAINISNKNNIPLNSLEGFIRQVLGWREFIRAVYSLKGVEVRKKNYWDHHRKIPKSFYEGTTGIPPIDETIKKLKANAYCHHIERLMVLGNYMLLSEFDPEEVYKWFMEVFIDSYDWVMVPNVFGMSQFADGGFMSTKPYISGSNYILKMSDYKAGDWCITWDALYWNFIHKHQHSFAKNPRMSMMVHQVNKMNPERFNYLQAIALNELAKK